MIKDKILEITNEELDAIDLSTFNSYISDYYKQWFYLPSGEEHYRLLVKLSTLFNEEIIYDIGTHHGVSALCLASSTLNKVISYDIEEDLELSKLKLKINESNDFKNIEFKLGNVLKDPQLLLAKLIFVDVNHEGVIETEILDFLKKNNYNKGLALFDDIYVSEKMQKFWNVTCKDLEKIDLSYLGHWSGSGMIVFNNDKI